jgi:hypothetical protein
MFGALRTKQSLNILRSFVNAVAQLWRQSHLLWRPTVALGHTAFFITQKKSECRFFDVVAISQYGQSCPTLEMTMNQFLLRPLKALGRVTDE